MTVEALDLDPEALAIGNDEAEIADLRNVDARMVDLVNDPAADREPHARGTERTAHDLLGAARPGRRNAGRAGRLRGERFGHCVTLRRRVPGARPGWRTIDGSSIARPRHAPLLPLLESVRLPGLRAAQSSPAARSRLALGQALLFTAWHDGGRRSTLADADGTSLRSTVAVIRSTSRRVQPRSIGSFRNKLSPDARVICLSVFRAKSTARRIKLHAARHEHVVVLSNTARP